MAKGKKNEKTVDADEAVRRAYSAAAEVKPKDAALGDRRSNPAAERDSRHDAGRPHPSRQRGAA